MPRSQQTQLNIRSAFAKTRTQELARITGMTAVQIVEDALRAYVPPSEPREVGALVRRGRILVIPARGGAVTLQKANAALEAGRNGGNDD